jgi:hypothetical protein
VGRLTTNTCVLQLAVSEVLIAIVDRFELAAINRYDRFGE